VDKEYQHAETTDLIIKGFYSVYNALGYGFLEKVYLKALALELRKLGLEVGEQSLINVYYGDHIVGEYFADLLVDKKVIIEIKAVQTLADEHEAQLLDYLKATPYEVGLLLNFGSAPQIRRKVFSNNRKGNLAWISKAAT
jgi:GxxExxY protein